MPTGLRSAYQLHLVTLYTCQMRTPMLPDDYQHHLVRQKSSTPGRMWAGASMMCGAWSLFIAPAVLGPLCVAAGMVAIAKSDKWWGAAGVSGSAVAAAAVGYYWVAGVVG